MSETENNLSIGGNIWRVTSADERLAEQLMQSAGLTPMVARVLAARGVTPQNVENFLYPKLQNLMPDPSCLKGMDMAAQRLADAIVKGEKVGIIGDYDVDGATSSAVLRLFLENYGIKPLVHIPDRDEGYGPSRQAFAEFSAAGINLVVTTDCGTTAFDVLDQAAEQGFDILVLDHHEAETRLPKVLAVVNPKRLDEDNSFDYLQYMAAVGVVYLTVAAVQRELRNRGYLNRHAPADLLGLLDLVALGTVCDVVPLVGLNRAYVRQGLKVMSRRQNIGLRALCDLAEIKEAPSGYHLGFVLGPRINAGGRVGDATAGNRLLCSKDPVEARQIAENLNQFNTDRKEIESYVLLEAIEQIESRPAAYPIAFAAGKNWHQGVIGIVAGKLKERYNLPAFVMSIEADEVKGSARSIAGVDLGALIMAAKEKGILTKGGGHIMAAGFSLEEERIDDFCKFAGEYVSAKLGNDKPVPELLIDGFVSVPGANLKLAEDLQLMEPFGAGNPEPRIVIENAKIIKPSIVGSGHIRCLLGSDLGNSVKAIAFRAADTSLGTALLNGHGERFNIAGVLRKDSWQGSEYVQFIIEDMKRVS